MGSSAPGSGSQPFLSAAITLKTTGELRVHPVTAACPRSDAVEGVNGKNMIGTKSLVSVSSWLVSWERGECMCLRRAVGAGRQAWARGSGGESALKEKMMQEPECQCPMRGTFQAANGRRSLPWPLPGSGTGREAVLCQVVSAGVGLTLPGLESQLGDVR